MLGNFLEVVMKEVLQTTTLIAVPIPIAISAEEAVGGNVVVGTGTPSSCNEVRVIPTQEMFNALRDLCP